MGMTEADDKWLQHGHDATSLCGTMLALLPFLDSCTQISANEDYSRRPFALLLLKKLSGEYMWSLAMRIHGSDLWGTASLSPSAGIRDLCTRE